MIEKAKIYNDGNHFIAIPKLLHQIDDVNTVTKKNTQRKNKEN